MYVAVYKDEYRDELPLIGRVVVVPNNSHEFELEWYVGSYCGTWKVCKRKVGRQYVNWTEKIKKDEVILNVPFTKSMRLRKDTITTLKSIYNDILKL